MAPRLPGLFASLVLMIFAPACDSEDAKRGSDEAPAKSDSKSDSGAGKAEDSKVKGEDASQAKRVSDPCKALANATQEACRHELNTGARTGCMMALTSIGVASEQAGGQLFDLGPDNQRAADVSCRSQLKTVQKKHAKVKDAPAVNWAPTCAKYIKKYDETCLANLGTKDRDATCSRSFVSVQAPLRASDVAGSESGCEALMN